METLWSTIGPGVLAPVLAWLATYVVHSTLLLGCAWGAARWLRRRGRPGALALEERIWKTALLGGLLTAGLQIGLGALPPTLSAAIPGHAWLGPAVPGPWAASLAPGGPSGAGLSARPGFGRPDPRLASPAALLPGWQRLALAAWLLGALALSATLLASWIRLRLSLRRRREVGPGPARLALERLLARAGTRRVRLTGSPRLPVPVALGVAEREICLPHRALAELDDRQQEGLVAHELAHLERRDPAWLLAGRAIENLFFFQPLNRVARRRLQEISEYRSDAWAVAATGDRLGLARCLTEVAAWLADRRHAAPVPGMARSRRHLGERVRRILEPAADAADDRGGRRLAVGAAAAALVLTVLLAPGMSPTSLALEAPPAAPAQAAGAAQAQAPAAPGPDEAAKAQGHREGAPPQTPPDRDRQRELEPALGRGLGRDLDRDLAQDLGADLDRELERELRRGLDGTLDPGKLAAALASLRAAVPDPAAMAEIERQIDAAAEQLAASRSALAGARSQVSEELQERVRAEMDRARRELERTSRQLREESLRDTLAAQREARRQAERQADQARREIEAGRRELERRQRDLERQRRDLERQREQLRRERGETSPPPDPGS